MLNEWGVVSHLLEDKVQQTLGIHRSMVIRRPSCRKNKNAQDAKSSVL
jgi:hypothetical protein